METNGKATVLWGNFFKLSMPQIRAFHMSWFAFFLCFFAWFGIAPLIHVVRDELKLTPAQIGWSMIASVAMTVIARLAIGQVCDRVGPRRAYAGLLIVGSLPVMAIGLAHDPITFIFFRLLIGMIGASFVITQHHTSLMFAPNVVGTAMATSAGWGNLGGGVTQLVMPLAFGGLVSLFSLSPAASWRITMLAAGILCLLTGIAYYFLTQDTPQGDFIRKLPHGAASRSAKKLAPFRKVCLDRRVWVLFAAYGACFGIELTMNNVIALYFYDYFAYFRRLDPVEALWLCGAVASLFGATNLFARTLGGSLGDRCGARWGLRGRVFWLFMVLLCEGVALMFFSQVTLFAAAVPGLLLLSILVQAAEGATFAIVPFVSRKSLGTVSGIVGSGGNLAAIGAGFLFGGSLSWPTAFLALGIVVTLTSFLTLTITFSATAERNARQEYAASLRQRLHDRSSTALQLT